MTAGRAAWLQERQQYIGSSDIARLLGLAPDAWGGAFKVWQEKTQPVDPDDGLEWGYWGLKLEPLIAGRYGELWDRPVRPYSEAFGPLAVAEDRKHCAATPDWYAPAQQQGDVEHLIECKTASAFMADQWGPSGEDALGNVPNQYVAQVRWQMGCLGHHEAVLCVLIGGNDWRWYPVFQDDDWWEEASAMADAWFEYYVLNDHVPDPDQRSDIVLGESEDAPSILVANDDVEALVFERLRFQEEARVAAAEMKGLDVKLCAAMGQHANQINLRDGRVAVTWRTTRTGNRRLMFKPLEG